MTEFLSQVLKNTKGHKPQVASRLPMTISLKMKCNIHMKVI